MKVHSIIIFSKQWKQLKHPGKQNVISPYNVILFNHKYKRSTATCYPRIDLENIMPGERSQTQKATHITIPEEENPQRQKADQGMPGAGERGKWRVTANG